MDNLTINWREEIIKLFPEITHKTKKEKDNWCSICNGLGLIRDGDYIAICIHCYGTGIKKVCGCGQKIDFAYYKKCSDCRSLDFKKTQEEKYAKLFEKANKTPFNEYKGMFLWNEYVIDHDELEEKLEDMIYDNEDIHNFIWGTKKEKVFTNISLEDVVCEKCEDGYEDMISYFNFKDDNFIKAQDLLDKWLKKHDHILDIYYEDYKIAVLLDDVINKIKKSGD